MWSQWRIWLDCCAVWSRNQTTKGTKNWACRRKRARPCHLTVTPFRSLASCPVEERWSQNGQRDAGGARRIPVNRSKHTKPLERRNSSLMWRRTHTRLSEEHFLSVGKGKGVLSWFICLQRTTEIHVTFSWCFWQKLLDHIHISFLVNFYIKCLKNRVP